MSEHHVGRRLARAGRHVERLLPLSQREWGRALIAELDEIDSAPSAVRWLFGGTRVVIQGWMAATGGEAVMKTMLVTLSIINALMGVALLGLILFSEDVPPVVAGLGIGLLIQSGYTLAYMTGLLRAFEPWSLRALVAGQTVALIVGVLGFVSSGLYNIDPPNGDYEYGPLAVGTLIAFQAAVALWVYAVPTRSEARV